MAEPIRVDPIHTPTGSLAPEYFDRIYAANPDPWDFETSVYEAAKYAASLAALPRPHYVAGLELGCSIGVFSRLLSERCATLVATDVSAVALEQARARCADRPNITFEQRELAGSFPAGCFDLIVVSELGYYFAPSDLEHLRENIAQDLAPLGHLLLVHYTGCTNYPLSGDAVHKTFLEWEGRWKCLRSGRNGYRLDLLEKIQPVAGESIGCGYRSHCE